MRRISSAQWWNQVALWRDTLGFLVGQARTVERQELRQAGAEHECGHRWEITIRSSTHSSGAIDGGPKSHRDSDLWSTHPPVTVRAHNVREALLVAATLPTSTWLEKTSE